MVEFDKSKYLEPNEQEDDDDVGWYSIEQEPKHSSTDYWVNWY